METIQKAKEIALKDLRSCYRDAGILASNINFNDFWARDSFWVSLGLIETNEDLGQVRKSLELFLSYQRSDGKIPRKIALDYNGLKYLGIKIKRKKPRPIYTSSIKWFFSMDDNLLLVMAFCKYVEKTQDFEFAQKYFSQVKKALEFYNNQKLIKEFLIYEIGFGNWEDTIYKKGFVLYTNCLWHEAVKNFEKLCASVETRHCLDSTESVNLPSSQQIISQIQKQFWLENEEYFADSAHKNAKQKYFDLAGNVLAIIFDIADGGQAEKILQCVETHCNASLRVDAKNILHALNYPRYPWWKISPVMYLFDIQDYQNGISWSWIEAMLIAAEMKTGKVDEAKKHLENFSNIIIKNGHVHETYCLSGRPFDHMFWKSAVPFAWGAGLFLYAVSRLKKNL